MIFLHAFVIQHITVYHYKSFLGKANETFTSRNSSKIIDPNGIATSLSSESMSCEFLVISDINNNNLICFYLINYYLVASVFSIGNGLNRTNDVFTLNNGAVYLKSALSSNRTKAYICYVTYTNKLYCNYFSNSLEWGKESLIFTSTTINNNYFDFFYDYTKDEYVIRSQKDYNDHQIAILNSNFKNSISNDDRCTIYMTISNCSYIFNSYIIYSDAYYILYNCNDEMGNYIFGKIELKT